MTIFKGFFYCGFNLLTLNLTIGHRDKDPQFAQAAKPPSIELGLTVQTITPSLAQPYNLK